ncbi:patched domain-containing protein 3-like [Mizuhopecten yessoensis]|uniref:Patched domain-containing protein 3 n=1 Tax=Mizuhopecten yessoensis TaxID=6573 RepID=A0A210Q3Y3_MIZYE|nr:patched domain-containing protein 3-like [Mizuhopecten yessoensis]XP_021367769.1 patched domain-containing protein 3-like [Mizuhopecten yessoensis]OWF43457.1 Patched domain-containing protein 3 [Mizuhopecten yessoensis]
MDFYRKVENKVSGAFVSYGRFISRRPWSAIIFSVMLNGILGINIYWLSHDTNLERLYNPTDSQAERDRAEAKRIFPDASATNFEHHSLNDLGLYGEVIVRPKTGGNILNKTYIEDIKNLFATIRNTSVTADDGEVFNYESLCARRDGMCIVDGLFVLTDDFWTKFELGQVEDDILFGISTLGEPKFINGSLLSATGIKMQYNLRQDTTAYKSLSKRWEIQYLDKMASVALYNIDLAYSMSDSLSQELNDNTRGDVGLFSVTFSLMITYASIVAVGGNWVSQRGNLGRAGVLPAGLAIMGSFGFCSAIGVDFVNMVGIMPFLILGIGVDDMYILMSSLADAPFGASVEDRIAFTLQTSGVAITITSLTDFIAFMAGTLSVFKSVRNFCFYTGVAVALCYINVITFFLACMVLHERRVAQNRHCLTCIPLMTGEESRKANKSTTHLYCCTGRPPKSREEYESVFEKFPRLFLPKVALFNPAKIVTLVTYVIYLAVSIWGACNLEEGLKLKNLVSPDSYYYRFNQWNYHYFDLKMLVTFIVPEHNDFSNPRTFDSVQTLMSNVKSDHKIDNRYEINWLKTMQETGFYDRKSNVSEKTFVKSVHSFVKTYKAFQNDVVFDEKIEKIIAAKFHLFTGNVKTSQDQGGLMLRMREFASDSELNVFAFSPWFIYFEQFVAVLPNTLQTVGVAVLAVFIITCLFMPSPKIILFVTVSMASIILGLVGFMHHWGLSLSSITMIHVIMSVGFSVDFSAHICHAFMTADGTDRNARVNTAVIRAGGPIFNGAFTSILGVFMLIFSKSYVFVSFFKVMTLVIIFGVFHAVLVLPVVLSLFGPDRSLSVTEEVYGAHNKNGNAVQMKNGEINHAYQVEKNGNS